MMEWCIIVIAGGLALSVVGIALYAFIVFDLKGKPAREICRKVARAILALLAVALLFYWSYTERVK